MHTKTSSSPKTVTHHPLSFIQVIRTLPHLADAERETIELLLDDAFTRTVLERGKEIGRLRKTGKLVPFARMRKSFRK